MKICIHFQKKKSNHRRPDPLCATVLHYGVHPAIQRRNQGALGTTHSEFGLFCAGEYCATRRCLLWHRVCITDRILVAYPHTFYAYIHIVRLTLLYIQYIHFSSCVQYRAHTYFHSYIHFYSAQQIKVHTMYVCVCMYVCKYVRKYVCMYVCM